MSIDLTSGFTTSTVSFNISDHYSGKYNQPALWYNTRNDSIYEFGGEHSDLETVDPVLAVWRLDLDDDTWYQNTSSQSVPFNTVTRPVGGSWASTNDWAFYLGGYSDRFVFQYSPLSTSSLTFVALSQLHEYLYRELIK